MSKVTVVANEDGNVVHYSEANSGFGHIRVEQTRSVIDEKGWLTRKKLIAFIPGKVEDLEDAGYAAGQVLNGKIIIKESVKPFNVKNPEKDIKLAGITGIMCKVGDEPIYRKCMYTEDLTQSDEFIQHTNSDEIKSQYKRTITLKPTEDFSL